MDEPSRVRESILEWNTRFQSKSSTLVGETTLGGTISPGDFDFSEFGSKFVRARMSTAERGVELLKIIDDFCQTYLQATPGESEEMRRLVANDHSVLKWLDWYAGAASNKLQSTGAPRWLQRSLAAQSLIDQRRDFREVYLSLGTLYIAAKEAGIDPQPYFRAIADISSSKTNKFLAQISTRDLLASFEGLPFFKEDVLPYLHK